MYNNFKLKIIVVIDSVRLEIALLTKTPTVKTLPRVKNRGNAFKHIDHIIMYHKIKI